MIRDFKLGLALISIAIISSASASPKIYEKAEAHKFALYGLQKGLSHPVITAIHQDNSGIIWVGTQRGVNSFDGLAFNQPDPSSQANKYLRNSGVRTISSNQENIYVGTTSGLSTYNTITGLSEKWTDIDKQVYVIERDHDELLIGTSDGMYIGNPIRKEAKLIHATKDFRIQAVLRREDDSFLIGTTNGLLVLDPQRFEYVNSFQERMIVDIERSAEGIWVATKSKGLYLLNSQNQILKSFHHARQQNESISGSEIHKILVTKENKVWIGTDKGIAIIENGSIRRISGSNPSPDSLGHPVVRDFLEDNQGSIWVGTFNELYKVSEKSYIFPHLSEATADELGNSILGFFQAASGDVWISSLKSLAIWDALTGRFSRLKDSPPITDSTRVMTMAQSDQSLYFGTMRKGIHVKRNLTNQTYSINSKSLKLPSNRITNLRTLTDQSVLVSTLGGDLFTISDEIEPKIKHLLEKPKSSPILSVELDGDNTVWFTNKAELTHLDLDSGRQTTYDLQPYNQLFSGFFDPLSLTLTRQDVWVGSSNNGLLRLNKKTKQVTHYTDQHGLPTNLIYAVQVGDDGNIWASSLKGIFRLNPDSGKVHTFSTSHGLQGDDFNAGASLKMSDGTLLFGGNNGFNAFNPRDIKLNEHKGQTLVTSFSKMNERQPGRFLSDGSETLKLLYEENVFSFEFALMDFISPKDNTYEYQLVGFDPDWVDAGSRNTATYTNLPPGSYLFQVRGRNNDGLLTDKIGSINVIIAPPWWLTWYAYAFYILAAIALTFAAFQLYAKRIERLTIEKRNREEKQRLENLVAKRTEELRHKILEQAQTLKQKEIANKEIHHRVKNNLQVILGLLTLQAESEDSELFREAMDQIRQRITSMSLIHKSLYENHVASIDFKQYTENLVFSIQQFHPDLASGQIQVSMDVAPEVLDIDTALPVGLILNELITNSIKHGFKDLRGDNQNLIRILFSKVDQNYVLQIIDNGNGLPAGFNVNSPTSMGSELTLIFSQQLEGTITATDTSGGGASFTFQFPVTENIEAAPA